MKKMQIIKMLISFCRFLHVQKKSEVAIHIIKEKRAIFSIYCIIFMNNRIIIINLALIISFLLYFLVGRYYLQHYSYTIGFLIKIKDNKIYNKNEIK